MNNNELDDFEVLHLNNCATSTRMGMVDKGFPSALKRLQAKGLVQEKDGGYIITTLGFETLKLNVGRVHLPKHRQKKQRWKDYDDDDQT